MPIIDHQDYKPGIIFRQGHINTLFPYIFRIKPKLPYSRKRYTTPDADFYDVDWLLADHTRNLVVLLHGLEGSSASQYINGMSRIMAACDFNVAAINFRSCSGEMNKNKAMYHSGFTQDLDHFLSIEAPNFDNIYLCGFSLGGNVVMKYSSDGKYQLPNNLKAVAGISVPIDLQGGSHELKKWSNRMYEKNFLGTLLKKIKKKHRLFPDEISLDHIKKVKTLWDFDEYYTASLHGFKNAEDYYRQCSSLPFLNSMPLPALLINALDDSFLAPTAYPYAIAAENPNFHLLTPRHGGHVGFATFRAEFYWTELIVKDFFMNIETQS